jgi:hypothetical protein
LTGGGKDDATTVLQHIERFIGAVVAPGGARAVVIVADGTEREGNKRRDIVMLLAEHRDGEATQMAVPYRRRFGRPRFGEPMLRPGERKYFG